MRYRLLPLLLLCTVFSHAREVVLTEKPIAVRLPINKEVIVKFPEAVTHTNMLNEQSGRKLSTLLSPDGVLYMTATEEFDSSRMVAELVSGSLVMLDVSALPRGPFDSDISIVERQATPVPTPAPATTAEAPKPETIEKNPYKPAFLEDGSSMTLNAAQAPSRPREDYHRLVQMAFRQFYGPHRLASLPLGEKQTVSQKALANFVRLNDGKLQFRVLQSQKISDKYLTVLLVENRSANAVAFEPRAIRGRWLFAAALHPVIEPAGGQNDRTLWALISAVPFDKARR